MALFCVIIKFIEDPDRTSSTTLRYGLMIAAVGLLGVSIVFGKITYGASNWISIGGISLQPVSYTHLDVYKRQAIWLSKFATA